MKRKYKKKLMHTYKKRPMVFPLSLVDHLLNPSNNNNKLLLNNNINNPNINNSKLPLLPMLVKLMLRLSPTVLKPTTTTLVLVNGILNPSRLVNKCLPTINLYIYTHALFFYLKNKKFKLNYTYRILQLLFLKKLN